MIALSFVGDHWQSAAEFAGIGLAAWWARRAERHSRPTGNGWAQNVLDRLVRIENKQDRLSKRVRRLEKK